MKQEVYLEFETATYHWVATFDTWDEDTEMYLQDTVERIVPDELFVHAKALYLEHGSYIENAPEWLLNLKDNACPDDGWPLEARWSGVACSRPGCPYTFCY